jgi:NAD(P)-dependent dehydrogenase (short-subunit alcohol dehydrogenase family)
VEKTISTDNVKDRNAYIITGPTSGIGRATALELAKHGTVVLVGRDARKLSEIRQAIERKGQRAVAVVCDLSDIAGVRRAVAKSSRFTFRSSACSTTRESTRRAPRRTRTAGT